MRNAGERVPSGASGRRHRAAGPQTSPRTGAGGGNGGASLFTPAYRASHAAAGEYPGGTDPAGADSDQADAPYQPAAPGRPAFDQPGRGSDWGDQEQPAAAAWAEQDRPGSGYGWADADQPDTGYGQPGDQRDTGYGQPGDQPDIGYGRPGDQPDTGYGQPGDQSDTGYSWAADDLTSAGHSWSRTDLYDSTPVTPPVSNAVRGFPPAPGDPLPVYPPGPFAAWNRGVPVGQGSVAAAVPAADPGSSRELAAATITPTEFDTDYSLPAIKDPIPGREAHARPDAGSGRQSPTATAARSRPSGSHGSRARRTGSGRSRSRGRQQPVRLAVGAAVVIIAAVTVILVSSLGGTPTASHPGATGQNTNPPGSLTPSPTSPPGKWLYIGTRATDPVPLTGVELFPGRFANAGVSYSRSATTGGKFCRSAVIGATLQAALRAGGCTQEVRATYLSRTAKMMATIGVFNLKSFTAASKAALAAGTSEFVAQLPAKSGPTHHIGSGTGLEEALVKGHYLILVWAEFLKLHAPKTPGQRQQLEAFMNLLITHTANASLSVRMVDGKPPPAAPGT
jgi:hypothetical protein